MNEKEPTKNKTDKAWETKKELAWIQTIGDTANNSIENQINEPKLKFLAGYIKSCKTRVQWGEIDKDICLKRANEILGKLQNGY